MSTTIKRAILWSNGMVMTFDESGRQIPEYQGRGTEIIPLIRRDFPDIIIEGMDWAVDVRGERKFQRMPIDGGS